MYFKKAAQVTLILSVVTLFNKTVPILGVKLDVLFLLLSAGLLLVAYLKKEVSIDWPSTLLFFVLLSGIILSTVLGSLLSLHIYGSIPLDQILTQYQILIGCFIIFFEILILGMGDNNFVKWLLYAFMFSLIAIITPYIPIDALQQVIGTTQHRFYGFIGDANYYPTFMMVPTILLFYFLAKELQNRKSVLKAFFIFILFAITIALTYWSGSRSGWLGVIAELLIFSFFAARANNRKVLRFFVLIIISITALATGYLLLPTNAKSDIKLRVGYITTPTKVEVLDSVSGVHSETISRGENSVKTIPIIDALSYNQDRLHIWLQGVRFLVKNPLGYGLVYYNIVNIVSAENHVSAHSFILETLLIGGPLLFFSLLYILGAVIIRFISYKRINSDIDLETVVFSSLIGFLTSSFFLSSLLLRWFWIQLAILIILQINRGAYSKLFNRRKKLILDKSSQPLEK